MMTASESKNISIKVTNTTDRHLSPNVRIEISTPLTLSESFDYIDLAPGESATLKKPIGAENIDLDKFIFVDVLVYSAYPMANQESMCGVFILPFGTNGAAILTTGTILSLLLIACGVYFLRKLELRKTILTPLLVIAFLILPALAFSFLGWWLQTILVLVVFILMLGIVIGNFVAQ